MVYRLVRPAPGGYDVVINGIIIAGLMRGGSTTDATWTAKLLVDLPPQDRPAPFPEPEHTFVSLDEARTRLGGAGS